MKLWDIVAAFWDIAGSNEPAMGRERFYRYQLDRSLKFMNG